MIRSPKYFLLGTLAMILVACGGQDKQQSQQGPSQSSVAAQLVDPDSAGAQVMKKHCSSCHAPPKPTAHPAEEWPNVVYRMSEKLRLRGYKPMTEQEVADLVGYLQQHAKGS